MKPIRSYFNGIHKVQAFIWNHAVVIYVDNKVYEKSWEEAKQFVDALAYADMKPEVKP